MYSVLTVFILCFVLGQGTPEVSPSSECPTIEFPSTFYLRGQWEAYWHEKVYIMPESDTDDDSGREYGLFESICMSFNGDVELTDSNGNVVGYTDKQTAFEWGTEFNIYDCTDQKIWLVEADDGQVVINGLNPFTSLFGVYEISDGVRNQIGFAVDGEVSFDSEYSIRNMRGEVVAHASKSFGDDLAATFGSDTTWTVTTYGNNTYPYNLILSYLVALEEVQDRLGDSTYDTCTEWTIFGYVLLGIVILIVIILLICCGYCFFTSDTVHRCGRKTKYYLTCCDLTFCGLRGDNTDVSRERTEARKSSSFSSSTTNSGVSSSTGSNAVSSSGSDISSSEYSRSPGSIA